MTISVPASLRLAFRDRARLICRVWRCAISGVHHWDSGLGVDIAWNFSDFRLHVGNDGLARNDFRLGFHFLGFAPGLDWLGVANSGVSLVWDLS